MESGFEDEVCGTDSQCETDAASSPRGTACAVAPFESWKDPRGYHATLKCCVPCLAAGRPKVSLPNRSKALNHWAADDSGRDPSATIKNCMTSASVPGLREYARQQNALRKQARELKAAQEAQQRQLEAASQHSQGDATTSALPGSLRKPGSQSSAGCKQPSAGNTIKFQKT